MKTLRIVVVCAAACTGLFWHGYSSTFTPVESPAVSALDADSVPPPILQYPENDDSISVYVSHLNIAFPDPYPWYIFRHQILAFSDAELQDTVINEYVGGGHLANLSCDAGDLPLYHEYWWKARVFDSLAVSDWSELRSFYLRTPRAFYVPSQRSTVDAALHSADPYDSIMIEPGVYVGNFIIRTDILVQGTAGPEQTVLMPSSTGPIMGVPWPFHHLGGRVQISNLTFAGAAGSAALRFQDGRAEISNCIFRNITASDAVIYDERPDPGKGPLIHHCLFYNCFGGPSFACINSRGPDSIYNNVFYNVSGGIETGNYYSGPVYIRNNIFERCGYFGIEANPSVVPADIDYNLFFANTADIISDSATGTHRLFEDPMFVDSAHHDFHLQAASPAIDAGDPNPFFDDPDGTRGDIGLFPFLQNTGVNDDLTDGLPNSFALEQNYPNPFNPSTVIRYSLPKKAGVKMTIYNVLGQSVRTLVNREQPAGRYDVVWDGTDNQGFTVATGVYLYRLTSGTYSDCRKMILMK